MRSIHRRCAFSIEYRNRRQTFDSHRLVVLLANRYTLWFLRVNRYHRVHRNHEMAHHDSRESISNVWLVSNAHHFEICKFILITVYSTYQFDPVTETAHRCLLVAFHEYDDLVRFDETLNALTQRIAEFGRCGISTNGRFEQRLADITIQHSWLKVQIINTKTIVCKW